MFSSNIKAGLRRPVLGFAAGLAASLLGGCASAIVPATETTVFENSPRAVPMSAREAWRMAEDYVAKHADCDVVVGSGGSMLPLYRDRTVLVIERMPMTALRPGMTVVFIGDSGRPVAHFLLRRTLGGWLAAGLNNRSIDNTLVHGKNYLGTVVRAFAANPTIVASDGTPPSPVADHGSPGTTGAAVSDQ
jgi:hypothetical protein